MTPRKYIPKYQEIINQIRAEIANGTLVPGAKLPIREELMVQYQVARTTIDRAISEMIRTGDLEASRRNGTFIARQQEDKIAILSWRESIYGHRAQWDIPSNFCAIYGQLLRNLPSSAYRMISPDHALKHPEQLCRYRRVLWLPVVEREKLEMIADVLGDRSRMLLLNRTFPEYSYISTDHRQASYDLTKHFLEHLPHAEDVICLDMPNAQNLSSREVWEERIQGFVDACAQYRKFYRIVKFKQNDYHGNLKVLLDNMSVCSARNPGIIISPSRNTVGVVLGFLNTREARMNREYYYGDFDNDQSLYDYGLAIPSVLQNYAAIGKAAAEALLKPSHQQTIPHCIVNSPWDNKS